MPAAVDSLGRSDNFLRAASPRSGERDVTTTVVPASASRRAISKPMPLLAANQEACMRGRAEAGVVWGVVCGRGGGMCGVAWQRQAASGPETHPQ